MSEMLSIAGNSDREWPYLCHMLHRFPPPPDKADTSFIASKTETFAKLKTESLPNQRTVLMTGHTLIFVLKGVKLLHFPDMTVRASPGEVILLRKGIYVMMIPGIQGKLMGQVNLVLKGLQHLNPGGSFTLTSGIAAEHPARNGTCVAMINGAVNSFVLGAAQEMTRERRINAVSPGLVEDSKERYGAFFPGYNLAPMEKVVNAYILSTEGAVNGKILKVCS